MSYLIPFLSRGNSEFFSDNFLFEKGNIFVMDNHRLALWCWFQRMEKKERYNIIHIDAHPDMNDSALKHFTYDLWNMSLADYRSTMQMDINTPLFRWDNYLEIFLQKYPRSVGKTFSATHQVGSEKRLQEEIKTYDLLKFLRGVFSEEKYINDLPWIVNLDLDYFFSASPEKVELFSEDFLRMLAATIKQGLENKMIKVLTIALSPECCGSWEKAEKLLTYFSDLQLEIQRE